MFDIVKDITNVGDKLFVWFS